ncbi:MAG: DUF1080 domain-containing protein, partial [Clostridia bacterium]|nr:DUF1080 domain-containing protein [Clostridia bacterium]
MRKRTAFITLFLFCITMLASAFAFADFSSNAVAYGQTVNYTADFSSGKPSDWVYYDRSDSAFAQKIAKSANGITVGHTKDTGSGAIANYYGTVYKIAQSLNNVSDFTLEMSYRVTSSYDDTRWIGIMYHTNTDMADRLSGLMMNYRKNGKSAGSVVTAGEANPGFADFDAIDNAGPSHNGTDFITLKIVVAGDTATHYANGNQIISYSISSKTTDKNGGFALVLNHCAIEIKSFTITNAICSDVAQFFTADFSVGVNEFAVYEKCDTASTATATTYTDGAITGLQIQNTGSTTTPQNYFGSAYNIVDNAISNIGDFELTVRFRITTHTNESRWFGVAFHT